MERLRNIRKEKNISQHELAKMLEVAQNTVSQWENGTRKPDIDMLEKITEIFGVRIDWLLGRDDIKTFPEYVIKNDYIHLQSIYNDKNVSEEAKKSITSVFDKLYLLINGCLNRNDIKCIEKINLILNNIFMIGKGRYIVGEQIKFEYLKEIDNIKKEILNCIDYINENEHAHHKTDMLNFILTEDGE